MTFTRQNLTPLIGAVLLLVLVIGYVYLSSRDNGGSDTIPAALISIYKGSEIQLQDDHYKIDGKDLFARSIAVGDNAFFLVVENYKDQGGIYRFYSADTNPVLLKEVGTFQVPENNKQVFEKNLQRKDITGDGIEEIIVKVQVSGGNLTSYQILTIGGNSLLNIKMEGAKNDWVDFDEIDYENGYVGITWHGTYERGKTIYSLSDNSLVLVKTVELYSYGEEEGVCLVREKKGGEKDYRVIQRKQSCNVWTDSLDPYFTK